MKTITNKWLFLSDMNLAVDLSRIISRLEYSARKQAEDYFYENGKSLDERVKNEINSLLIERGYPEKIGDFQIIDIVEYYKRPDKSSKKEAIKVFLNQDENSFLYSFGFEPIPREEAKQEDISRVFGGLIIIPANDVYATFRKVAGFTGSTSKPKDYEIFFKDSAGNELLKIRVEEETQETFAFSYEIKSEDVFGKKLILVINEKTYIIYEFGSTNKKGQGQTKSKGITVPWKEIIESGGQRDYKLKLSE